MIGMIANPISVKYMISYLNFIHWYRAIIRVGGTSDSEGDAQRFTGYKWDQWVHNHNGVHWIGCNWDTATWMSIDSEIYIDIP